MNIVRSAVGAFFTVLVVTPFKTILRDVVREVMLEFAVDDPNAGGPVACIKCDGETESGICPECQPLAYARLP
jgi:hypothetical protein